MSSVVFKVCCESTQPGECVFLVGSHGVIGEWTPERALMMATSAEDFPVWSATCRLPASEAIEYKCVILREDRSGSARWEEFPGNHAVTPEDGRVVEAFSIWGNASVRLSSALEPPATSRPEPLSEPLPVAQAEPSCRGSPAASDLSGAPPSATTGTPAASEASFQASELPGLPPAASSQQAANNEFELPAANCENGGTDGGVSPVKATCAAQ
ncbi:unnamed protein product [Polarella glacialis]|uniref:CBM20 domain-containing protein n=1 Tax=Polarella glacialis TaxID=89957 RepID=A0A813HI08_POLGL|nr:unnamed protein product [Polarella glacialis]